MFISGELTELIDQNEQMFPTQYLKPLYNIRLTNTVSVNQLLIVFWFLLDEDAGFPASELNTHGPTVHGWRSAVDSGVSTHDIILRFHQPAKIYRIQLLAHQYLIRESGYLNRNPFTL